MSDGRRLFSQKFSVAQDHLDERYPNKPLDEQLEEFGRARYGADFHAGEVLDFKQGRHVIRIVFYEPVRH